MIDPSQPLGQAYVLSESDRDKFLTLWREYSHLLPRPKPDRGHFPDHEEHQAPEVYVARIAPGGIDALSVGAQSGTGTVGTLTDDDVPGSAICDIYQVQDISGIQFLRVIGLTQVIYNLFPTSISAGKWAVVARDKFGKWFITGKDYDPPDVYGKVLSGFVTAVSPGVAATGTNVQSVDGNAIIDIPTGQWLICGMVAARVLLGSPTTASTFRLRAQTVRLQSGTTTVIDTLPPLNGTGLNRDPVVLEYREQITAAGDTIRTGHCTESLNQSDWKHWFFPYSGSGRFGIQFTNTVSTNGGGYMTYTAIGIIALPLLGTVGAGSSSLWQMG